MNFVAKNLMAIFKSYKNDVLKINSKIIEEILERSFKYYKSKGTVLDFTDVFALLKLIRNKEDIFSLINYQRKMIMAKKVNCNKLTPI